MFLYPLIGGALFYFIIYVFTNKISKFKCYRLFFNIYNSGIATLTFGSFIKGILELAGADSIY
jgi:prolipoprotein diacylglyceryltransferase